MIVTADTIKLMEKGISLNKINKITGINKSTLYYHYKRLKGKKYPNITIDESDKEKIGEFIGIFAGDGNFFFDKKIYHYKISIYLGLYEKGYRKYMRKFLTNLFLKAPRTYAREQNNVEISEYYSKDIYNLIRKYLIWEDNKTKTIRLKSIKNKDKRFLIGFIRGLFDTDGGIYESKNKVAFGTASEALANQVKKILTSFDMPPGFYKYKEKDFWYIDLYGKRTDKFMKLVKPNNPNKIIEKLRL